MTAYCSPRPAVARCCGDHPFLSRGFLWPAAIGLAIGWGGLAGAPLGLADDAPEPQYPIAVVADGAVLYVVDLDLPGVWRVDDQGRSLFVRGSSRFRTPLNRPRCVALHPRGGILVGDSATREVYHIAAAGSEPKPLSDGQIGIAMTLAVSPDGQTLYVGDAETRSLLSLPVDGGQPRVVVQVNARGLGFDADGTLWAVTPDDAAVQRIDVAAKSSQPVISGRPYQYPNGLTWTGDFGLISDGYGKQIWKFTADGQTEPWASGDPLVGPVGLFAAQGAVWVADPKQRQLYRFGLDDRMAEPQL